jgi:hypothetical protein
MSVPQGGHQGAVHECSLSGGVVPLGIMVAGRALAFPRCRALFDLYQMSEAVGSVVYVAQAQESHDRSGT